MAGTVQEILKAFIVYVKISLAVADNLSFFVLFLLFLCSSAPFCNFHWCMYVAINSK